MAPTNLEFCDLLLTQEGDEYIFGVEASPSDSDPDAFDCSELVQWGCGRLAVTPTMPDGSWLQARHCQSAGKLISISAGIKLRGALLFKFSSDPFTAGRPASSHVAVSLGNGATIEARGKAYGVGVFAAAGRGWTHAAAVPGLAYEPVTAPLPADALTPEEVKWYRQNRDAILKSGGRATSTNYAIRLERELGRLLAIPGNEPEKIAAAVLAIGD